MKTIHKISLIAAAAALCAGNAFAVDVEVADATVQLHDKVHPISPAPEVVPTDAAGQFHGYFRAGAGSTSDNKKQACFGIGNVKYRLGNECDIYGEFQYTKELARSSNGVSFVGTVMANAWNPASDFGDAKLGVAQMFYEVKNLDFMKGGTAWMGKRYYNRPDIHMQDFKYVQMDGVGAGFDKVSAGPGKFSYALFRDVIGTDAASRNNFIFSDLAVNAGGTLRFDATVIRANARDDLALPRNNNGWSLSAAHSQSMAFGIDKLDNTVALQYGVGPGIKIGGTGDLSLGADVTRARLLDVLIWQATQNFSASASLVIHRDKSNAGSSTWTSVGTRPVYALTDNVKLQLDLGHDEIRSDNGGATQKLTKITFAPTLAVSRDFWSRPELRAFITYARWNDAAQAAATPGTTLSPTGSFGANTSGTTIGFQVETWF